ncbi:PD-(D/E)XK nuclease family protein [Candidatus Comchoanobacter bicostacola]|uniref:PD-(D/E)XK nuclease family protein n=1 Tax=Candidatus Comchoanobacter bicostacola TaxID=2919598 RepID=A0ABY5DMB7_9GAMM|nr:PD-(D/E)XK nuclease family protein [Candidatus Comchoanobacter bicostacola]UTC24977.1 PD-(D/E)XK nuclease family protein [Candidatus Comchoanobacter bicostacola]
MLMILIARDSVIPFVPKNKQFTMLDDWLSQITQTVPECATPPAVIHALLAEQSHKDHAPQLAQHIQQLLNQSPDWLQNFTPQLTTESWVYQHYLQLNTSLKTLGLYHPCVLPHLEINPLNSLHKPTQHIGLSHYSPAMSARLAQCSITNHQDLSIISSHKHYGFDSYDLEVEAALNWQEQDPKNRMVIGLNLSEYANALWRATPTIASHDHQLLQYLSEFLGPNPKLYHTLAQIINPDYSDTRIIPRTTYTPLPSTNPSETISHATFKAHILSKLAEIRFNEEDIVITNTCLELSQMIDQLSPLSLIYHKQPYSWWHHQLTQLVNRPDLPPIPTLKQVQGCIYNELWVIGCSLELAGQYTPPKWLPSLPKPQSEINSLSKLCKHLITSALKINSDGTSNTPVNILGSIEEQSYPKPKTQPQWSHYSDQQVPINEVKALSASKLQDFQQCPFKSFARHRLKLSALEPECLQPAANIYGNIVHDVLENLYQDIKQQSDLRNLSKNCIQSMINIVWQKHLSEGHEALTHILKETLYNRIRQWIEADQSRPDFNIKALESKKTIHLSAQYSINVRIDRIDSSNNQPILIDYKTGSTQILDALNPQLTQPQLPIYSLTQDIIPIVAYANITQKPKIQDLDLSCAETLSKKLKTRKYPLHTPESLKQQWTQDLLKIIDAYHQGAYPVQPANALTCQTCDFASLCRYHLKDEHYETR